MRKLAAIWTVVVLSTALFLAIAQDYNVPFRPRTVADVPIAYVSSSGTTTGSASSGTTCVTPTGFNTTTGNFLVCLLKHEGSALTNGAADVTASDLSSNAYTCSGYIFGNGVASAMCWATNITGRSNEQTTFTLASGRTWRFCACGQYSGVKTTSPIDTTYETNGVDTNTTGSTAVDVGSSTTTGAYLAVAGITNASSCSVSTWATGFTERSDASEVAMASRIGTTGETFTCGTAANGFGGGSCSASLVCMAFKDF